MCLNAAAANIYEQLFIFWQQNYQALSSAG